MKESLQKKVTKEFFNEVAAEWFERTYDPKKEFFKYPVNGARKDVAIAEIKALKKKGTIFDLGRGTGQMVIELRKSGYDAVGIDVAERMIGEAKKTARSLRLRGNPDNFFAVGDCLNLSSEKQYDLVTGLGLLEYLEGDSDLFTNLARVVRPGGYALIECRNKLFNLFSGNQYTVEEGNRGTLATLV